jgi:hypothetical protein
MLAAILDANDPGRHKTCIFAALPNDSSKFTRKRIDKLGGRDAARYSRSLGRNGFDSGIAAIT